MLQKEVNYITENYQRKMWKSMISRKNLNCSIWDAIEYKDETVYYMPYNGFHKFPVIHRCCLKCGKELHIGFRKNVFITSICNCSNDGKNYATVGKLTSLFNEEEAYHIISTFADSKTRKFPNKLQYWLDQGFTKEKAQQIIKDVQIQRSRKSPAAQKGACDYTCRRPEFWIKKGYSREKAIQKVSKHQIRNGLEWYISRYGDQKGRHYFNQRIENWYEKMSTLSIGISKVSNELFEHIDYDQYGRYGKNETTVRGKNKVHRIDYLDVQQRKIIEFHGEYWHADPNVYSAEDYIRNKKVEEIWKHDKEKIKDLEKAGFQVLIIKERDYYQSKQNVVNKCLEFLSED